MKLKLRKIGNSLGVIIPSYNLEDYKEGDVITITIIDRASYNKIEKEVITDKVTNLGNKVTNSGNSFNTTFCKKHAGSMKGTCGCK